MMLSALARNHERGEIMHRVQIVDSHTGGEPTRVVVSGGPILAGKTLLEQRDVFLSQHDEFRSAVVNEPRGSDVLVGALLCKPTQADCVAGVIFFNNIGVLGMCGHGMMGLIVTLAHLGTIKVGTYRIETPVGVVTCEYQGGNCVTIENVPCYRLAKCVHVTIPDGGSLCGDIAWGGNWFFLVADHGLRLNLQHIESLTNYSWQIRMALESQNITGANQEKIDHIELFAPPFDPLNDSRNFVLCPGKAYDRSPCGTGTSAKLACLYADGKLIPGQVWRQESITGSLFEGQIRKDGDLIIPRITGTAYVTAEGTLLLDPMDPLCMGIRNDAEV
jgi:4-hydroxyproline epimerase